MYATTAQTSGTRQAAEIEGQPKMPELQNEDRSSRQQSTPVNWNKYFTDNLDYLTVRKSESPCREILALGWFAQIIESSGIGEYLWNESGTDFQIVRDGAELIECEWLRVLMDEVENLFPARKVPEDWTARQSAMELMEKSFGGVEALDETFEAKMNVYSENVDMLLQQLLRFSTSNIQLPHAK